MLVETLVLEMMFLNFLLELKYLPFLHVADVGGYGRYRTDFQFYLFGGVGMFWNNPKAYYQGEWYALQPLMTEAQNILEFNSIYRWGLVSFLHLRDNIE